MIKSTKKFLAVVLAAIMILSVLPLSIFTVSAEIASGTCGDNLTWEYDTSTYTLTISGIGKMADYSNEYSVTNAPWKAYYDSIRTIVINQGVISIGNSAFYNCGKITSVTISDSVTAIGSQAFYGCSGLTNILIPGSITEISYATFSGCYGLTSITIPNGVLSIGNYAFSGCKSIIEITVPNSVDFIAEGAFSGCSSLEKITLPFVGDRRRSADSLYQTPFGYIFGTYNYAGSIATNQYDTYIEPNSWMTYTCYYIPAKLNTVNITRA